MLKLQYFGHLIRTANSLEKTLMLVKIEGRRKRGDIQDDDEMVGLHHPLNEQGVWTTLRNSEGQVSLVCCSLSGGKLGHNWNNKWLYKYYVRYYMGLFLIFNTTNAKVCFKTFIIQTRTPLFEKTPQLLEKWQVLAKKMKQKWGKIKHTTQEFVVLSTKGS